MSLDWSIEDVANNDELKIKGVYADGGFFNPDPNGDAWQLRSDAECLIWLSITCGYKAITEDNWREVFVRVAMTETITGAYRQVFNEARVELRYFTPAEVKRCIGLKTNATVKSRAVFDKEVALMVRKAVEKQLHDSEMKGLT